MEKEYVRRPHKLLDYLLATYQLKNDSVLSVHLQVKKPTLSKIRGGTLGIGANFILAVHDAFDIPIKDIKAMLAAMEEK